MTFFSRTNIVVSVLFLSIGLSACQNSYPPEPTITKTQFSSTSTAADLPTQTPKPTRISQIESNCPPGGWTLYTEEDGLADNWPWELVVDNGGRVLVGYLIGDISLLQNGIWTSMPAVPRAPTYQVTSIIPLENGNLWVGTQAGYIAHYRGGEWTMWSIIVEGENTSVYDMEIAPDGRAWAATWDGIYQLQGDKWVSIGKPVAENILFSGKSVHLDRKGGLWVGARYGLHYFINGGWMSITTTFEPIYELDVIEEDRFGNLWFGYRGGVLVFDGDIWKHVYPPEGTTEEDSAWTRVKSLAIGPNGRVWVIDSQGAAVYESGTWQLIIPGIGSPDIQLFKVDVDPWGAAWFVSNEGVLCYNP